MDKSSPCPNTTTAVVGITLHVEKCDESSPYELVFLKSQTNCVNIGRKSCSGDRAMRKESDECNAVFPCQVVSGKHAKLILADSGQVSVIVLPVLSKSLTHISS